MPTPSLNNGQDKEGFMLNCMNDPVMGEEFPDGKRRVVACYNKWNKSKGTIEIDLFEEENIIIERKK